MIDIASIAGAALLLTLAFWAVRSWRQASRDRALLIQDISELEAHAEVLAENSSQPIVKFEATGLIRMVNPAAEERFGYRADELLGQTVIKLLPEANFSLRLAETMEIRCKDGSRLRLPFQAVKSDAARPSCIYLFFETAPAPNPPKASLSYTAAIVGRIAGSYETLLTTINGYSELALMEAPENSPLRQDLEEIMNASNRASGLTRQLVAFSGSQFIPVEPVELGRLVWDMRAELAAAVECQVDFDLQSMDRAALANVDFLRQVILLLCGSARGRMRGTDGLVVRTHQCDFASPQPVQGGELKPGAYLVLTVSDSGRPIDPQSLEHLFEPLYPIHDDIGVELAPIYGIVQGLGGGIDVQTGDGGTAFEFLFPAVSAGQPRTTPAGSTLVEKS